MGDIIFVRKDMLAAQEAPVSQIGAVRWARENLFSGWLNTLLTVVSAFIVYWLLSHIWPWFAHSVWNATSLTDCRQITAATWGEGASGACFAVIRERWQQFLFGFYPRDMYWRPTLAFILMFVALAPILFSGAPRKILWFSLFFPGIAYWLLWGGSLLIPIAIYAGFVVGFGLHRLVSARASELLGTIAGIVGILIWWFYLAGPVANAIGDVLPLTLTPVGSKQFGGFMLSLTIGVTGIAFSLPLGILLALGRRSDMFLVKSMCVGFIEFIRGVPLITLLLVASFLLNIFLPPGTNFDIILRVIIMVTLFASAYMAEVIRGGLAALPRGQYEGADALGPRLLEVDAARHHATGAENLDPGHRQHLHRPVQGHDAGGDHRLARSRSA